MTRATRRLGAAAVVAVTAISAPAVLAAAWPGPPRSAPPKPATRGGPPPAWFESTRQARWLAYGNYCWRRRCIDYGAPALRPNITVLPVRRGASVRIKLEFRPRSVTVGYIREGAPPVPLAPAATLQWRPALSGRFELQVSAANGRASYVGALSLTP